MKIVGHMILGPREEPYLRFSLDGIASHVQHMVINDNGSNSQNYEEIKASRFYREKRLTYVVSEFTDFGTARNLCFDYTPEEDWNFMLRIDADEVWSEGDFEQVYAEVEDRKDMAAHSFRVHFNHLLAFDLIQGVETCAQIFRWNYANHFRWSGRVHETMVPGNQVILPHRYTHYGYTLPQREIYAKWKQYSDLVGDVHHYDGRDPENIISDRYATAGVLFPGPHPPHIQAFLQQKKREMGYHDVLPKVAICVRDTDMEKTAQTIQSVQETANPDFPFEIMDLDAQAFMGDFTHSVFRLMQAPDWQQFGSALILEAGTTFPAMGWLKAAVGNMYCHAGYDGYTSLNMSPFAPLLIPRDAMDERYTFGRQIHVHKSPYIRCELPG